MRNTMARTYVLILLLYLSAGLLEAYHSMMAPEGSCVSHLIGGIVEAAEAGACEKMGTRKAVVASHPSATFCHLDFCYVDDDDDVSTADVWAMTSHQIAALKPDEDKVLMRHWMSRSYCEHVTGARPSGGYGNNANCLVYWVRLSGTNEGSRANALSIRGVGECSTKVATAWVARVDGDKCRALGGHNTDRYINCFLELCLEPTIQCTSQKLVWTDMRICTNRASTNQTCDASTLTAVVSKVTPEGIKEDVPNGEVWAIREHMTHYPGHWWERVVSEDDGINTAGIASTVRPGRQNRLQQAVIYCQNYQVKSIEIFSQGNVISE